MSIYRALQILVALSFWTSIALSQTAATRTVSAMVSAASSTPALQQCDSICALMAYPIHGSDSSLFASYCEGTERTDCGVSEMQFKIDLIGAGQTLSFKCTCNLPPLRSTSSQLPTSTLTTIPVSKTTTTSPRIMSTALSSVSPLTSSLSSTATPTNLGTSTNTSITTSVSTISPTNKATKSDTSAKSTLSPVTTADKASPGTIVGIVIGVLCILACLGAGALAIYRRRQRRKIDQGYIDSFRACSAMPGSV